MFLSDDTMNQISSGKVSVTKSADGYVFDRFTPAQKRAFDGTKDRFPGLPDDYFRRNCDTDAGILLDMLTDAPTVTFGIASVVPANGSDRVGSDVLIDARLRRRIGEPGIYTVRPGRAKDGRLRRVTLVLPYFSRLTVESVGLPDGSTVLPVPKAGLWLTLGDSITQGVGATSPFKTHAGKLAVLSGYEILNQANSGYVHDAHTLCPLPDGRQPDIVTVAYGINDLGCKLPDKNESDMRDFYARLCELYPRARIYMISPLWTTFMGDDPKTLYGNVYAMFARVADAYRDRVTLIDGLTQVPHRADTFCPDGVHPADAGYAFYARRLMKAVIGKQAAGAAAR